MSTCDFEFESHIRPRRTLNANRMTMKKFVFKSVKSFDSFIHKSAASFELRLPQTAQQRRTSTGSHRNWTSLLLLPRGSLPMKVAAPASGLGWYCGSPAKDGASAHRQSSWEERERDVSVEDRRVALPSR